jgi:hypothetical protein
MVGSCTAKVEANNVFPFFFASHTSIWAQPHDAGIHKRFHWAIEQSAKTARRGEEQPTLDYFQQNTQRRLGVLPGSIKKRSESAGSEQHNKCIHTYRCFSFGSICFYLE